jgi:hypothetical protein
MPTSNFKGNEILGLEELGKSVLDLSVWIREVGGPPITQQPLTYVQLAEFPRIEPSAPEANHCNGGH